eukprot:SAG31_NODE_1563_length_7869_cov_6.990734_1_plen_73_part_00
MAGWNKDRKVYSTVARAPKLTDKKVGDLLFVFQDALVHERSVKAKQKWRIRPNVGSAVCDGVNSHRPLPLAA